MSQEGSGEIVFVCPLEVLCTQISSGDGITAET